MSAMEQNPPYFNLRKTAISGAGNVLSCLNRQTLWLQIRRFHCSGSISRNWSNTAKKFCRHWEHERDNIQRGISPNQE